MKTLSIVIPCYNSAENIADLQIALELLSKEISDFSIEVVLVDDGSQDNTFEMIQEFYRSSTLKVIIVKLTGNFGSYNAFLAGLHYGSGDVYAQVHPDMQDPPEHLPDMLAYYRQGIPFVIGQRIGREDKDSSQWFAKAYHTLVKKIGLSHIPKGGYDLILFDKTLRDHVVNMNEQHVNLVYLISWLRYPYVTVPITRISRKKGKSQWTFSKKSKLVADTIVAFSYTPVKWLTYSSILLFLLSLPLYIFTLFFSDFLTVHKLIISLLLLLINLTMAGISVLGEYLWRTLEAARRRPPFIVEKLLSNAHE